MGWIEYRIYNTPKEELVKEFTSNTTKVVDISLKSNVGYLLLEVNKEEISYKTILVVMYRYNKRYGIFAYKDISELNGPGDYKGCPKRIIDNATPLEEISKILGEDYEQPIEWAKNWRQKVVEYNSKPKNQFKNGSIIKLKKEIQFTNGNSCEYLKKIDNKIYSCYLINGQYIVGNRVKMRMNNYIEYDIVS